MPLDHLIPILQISIGPVIMISGIGLLVLSMTNRFSRIIERTRSLMRELRQHSASGDAARIEGQLTVLVRRARMMRAAIFLAVIAVLLAALLIIFLFLSALLGFQSATAIATIFVACLSSLIAALVIYLKDINGALAAIRLEVGPKYWKER